MVDFAPGEVLVRNINLGIDPANANYQLLYNVDLKQNVRCITNFGSINEKIK